MGCLCSGSIIVNLMDNTLSQSEIEEKIQKARSIFESFVNSTNHHLRTLQDELNAMMRQLEQEIEKK